MAVPRVLLVPLAVPRVLLVPLAVPRTSDGLMAVPRTSDGLMAVPRVLQMASWPYPGSSRWPYGPKLGRLVVNMALYTGLESAYRPP